MDWVTVRYSDLFGRPHLCRVRGARSADGLRDVILIEEDGSNAAPPSLFIPQITGQALARFPRLSPGFPPDVFVHVTHGAFGVLLEPGHVHRAEFKDRRSPCGKIPTDPPVKWQHLSVGEFSEYVGEE